MGGGLTKRAPDAGDSVAISSSFTRLSLFLVGRLRRPRPSAGLCPERVYPMKITRDEPQTVRRLRYELRTG